VTTGRVLQELLQGFAGPRARRDMIERFAASLLTTNNDFVLSAAHCPLQVWSATPR
jgi:hypothetical protein